MPVMGCEDLDLLAGGSLPRVWVDAWRRRPEAIALIDDGGAVTTAAGLERRSRLVAGALAAAGLGRGDRILLSASPSVACVVAYVACLRLGLVVVLCNPQYTATEVSRIAGNSDPTAALLDGGARASAVGLTLAPLMPVLDLVPGSGGEDTGLPGLDQAETGELALLMYTSGTTGAPKGAMLTHGNLLSSARAVTLAWDWTPADRLVLALPLFHAHGLCVGVNGTLLAGASAVVLPRFDPERVLDQVEAGEATMLFGVPTMYARLVASPRAALLARLRLCVSGSAPLPAALFEIVERLSGQRVLERYGMTETLMLVSNPLRGERRPGSVGISLPGVEVRLDGGAEGEISVRGPGVFAGYWRNPEATSAVLDQDGWFRTGDIGRLESGGYLRIVGRSKELIITGGHNVYPREVEEVLCAHPAVAEAAVVGLPSEEWGETVAAAVVAVPGSTVDGEELIAFARRSLAAYKVPRAVHRVEELPRNALGKVSARDLEALLGF